MALIYSDYYDLYNRFWFYCFVSLLMFHIFIHTFLSCEALCIKCNLIKVYYYTNI